MSGLIHGMDALPRHPAFPFVQIHVPPILLQTGSGSPPTDPDFASDDVRLRVGVGAEDSDSLKLEGRIA